MASWIAVLHMYLNPTSYQIQQYNKYFDQQELKLLPLMKEGIWYIHTHTYKQTETHLHRQTNRQIDIHVHLDRHTNRHRHTQHTYCHLSTNTLVEKVIETISGSQKELDEKMYRWTYTCTMYTCTLIITYIDKDELTDRWIHV